MLSLSIGRSPRLAMVLVMVHLVAFGLLLVSTPGQWVSLFAGLLLAMSAVHAVLLHAWQALPASIVELEMTTECKLRLRRADISWVEAELLPSSFVTPFLTILNLRLENQRFTRSLIIVQDRVEREAYRRLRVWLRWRCRKDAATDPALY